VGGSHGSWLKGFTIGGTPTGKLVSVPRGYAFFAGFYLRYDHGRFFGRNWRSFYRIIVGDVRICIRMIGGIHRFPHLW
jgi:hypothetical protein